MKITTRPLIAGLAGAAMMAFASCTTTSENSDYVTYPDDQGYDYGGDYGNYASNDTDTGVGGGGAYPSTPQDYGNDYGTDYGSSGTSGGGAAAGSGQTHTVQRGDNLYRISLKYGTSVANIKAANGLSSDLIVPGQVLVVR